MIVSPREPRGSVLFVCTTELLVLPAGECVEAARPAARITAC